MTEPIKPTVPAVPARVRHSSPAADCPFCLGIILRHWCDSCKCVHAFGHSHRCSLVVKCPEWESNLAPFVRMRDEEADSGPVHDP